jgi:dTDP-4-amino-4,6-dideoxygalactose transaminase
METLTQGSLIKEIEAILESGQLSPFFKDFDGGPYVQRLEKQFAAYIGTKHAVSMANGTLALEAAYTATRFPRGAEFVTTPWTFVATVSEIVRAGYTPIFADVDLETGALDTESVAGKITPKSTCIVPVHPLGVPCDMERFMELKKRYDRLLIIEDSCQALGSTYQGKMCGSMSNIGCFSLQQTKSVSSGEGGMAVTNDDELYDRLRHIRNHGNKYGKFQAKYPDIIASNYRLTEIQAAIAFHGMRDYSQTVKEQLARFEILFESLTASEELEPQQTYPKSTRNGYIIGSAFRKTQRDPESARQRFLEENRRFNKGIPGFVVGPGYSEPVYDLPAFRRFKPNEHPCPNAEELWKRSVWYDVRKMPVETVKDLAREIEKFRS